MNISKLIKKISKNTLKILLWFILINIIILFLMFVFDNRYRYMNLRLKKDLTPVEKKLIEKKPNASLYYMMTYDSSIYYYEYYSGVLVYEGGFYRINPNSGNRIKRGR